MLEMENLTLGYERHPAIHHLTTTIHRGDLLAVAGPNGAGKSTLLKGIIGQITPMEGDLRITGLEKEQIAYLPQQNQVDRSFPITVKELIGMGTWRHTGAFGRLRSSHQRKVADALARVGLSGFENRLVGTLSGGQMQRVLFARLLVQEADLILLDEPFSAIDQNTTQDLIALIQHWHQHGKTIIAVLHDFEQIKRYFPSTLLLSRRCIAHGATESVLTPENIADTRDFREAFDDNAEPCHLHEHSA